MDNQILFHVSSKKSFFAFSFFYYIYQYNSILQIPYHNYIKHYRELEKSKGLMFSFKLD